MKKITLIAVLLTLGQFAKAQETCVSAVQLNGAGLYVVPGIFGEIPSPICFEGGIQVEGHGAWYKYTPTAAHTVTVSTNIVQNTPRVDTRFQVYTGTCGNFTCLVSDDDSGLNYSSMATFNVEANVTYTIAFDNNWTPAGFTFQLIEGDLVIPPPTPVTFVPQNINTIIGSNYNMCAVDMNNDSRDDLVGVNGTNIRINYQNADGTFTAADFATTNADHLPGWSIAAGDYNKDGYNDLLYGSSNGLTFMKSNSTGTAYTEDTPGQYIFCQRTNFVDINNDGNLDAFSCHDVNPNVYYINNGSGGFTYYQSGITQGAYSLGITPGGGNYASLWTDYDNDGDVDMFISKCSGPPCELHRNDGNGVFTDISAIAGINVQPIQSWSSAIADFDNDGDMDILVGANGGAGNKFFRNNLDTSNNTEEAFSDITAGSGWDTNVSNNRDYIAYDFDNDGFVDVMGGGNKIMFNQHDNTFLAVSYPIGVGAVGDFNNDGFLDIQNGSTLYKAVPNGNNWLTVNLHGIQTNSNGIGARIEIYGDWGIQIRDIRSGEGFEFMSTISAHFGIGTATEIHKLVVRWPSGVVDVIENPLRNQSMNIVESSTLGISDEAVTGFSLYPNPATDMLHFKFKSNAATVTGADVFDLTGRKVLSSGVTSQEINVRSLASGTYVLLLKDENGKTFSQKFIKK